LCGSDKIATSSFDKTCRLWSADTGKCYYVFRGHTAEVVSSQDLRLQFPSPEGLSLKVASSDHNTNRRPSPNQ